MNNVMLGSNGLGFLVILNKSCELKFGLRRDELGFESGRGQWICGLRGARARWLSQWIESWRWTNSQHRKILSLSLSLSPRAEKPKLKEGNKSFVPEPRESSVFRVFRIPMRMNILCIWIFLPYITVEFECLLLISFRKLIENQELSTQVQTSSEDYLFLLVHAFFLKILEWILRKVRAKL